jgi:hypothetical protein
MTSSRWVMTGDEEWVIRKRMGIAMKMMVTVVRAHQE